MKSSIISSRLFLFLLLAATLSELTSTAEAAVTITGAQSATVNSGGTRPGASIANTFNQNGLSARYTNDLTLFQPYVSTTTHTTLFVCCEWFSVQGTTSASVTDDLGELDIIDGVALWNEEVSGIGTLDLFWSQDNIQFFLWSSSSLHPTNNPLGPVYRADVFNLPAQNLRYVRFDMSDCPQPNAGFVACSIGEVAFRDPELVPEPPVLLLLGIALAGMTRARRKKS